MMLGTIRQAEDGRWMVRFEREFAHSMDKVWLALTQKSQLANWFVEILDYEQSQLEFDKGATLRFVPKKEHGLPAGNGTVTRYDPPRLLEYGWDDETLRFELSGESTCRLVFTNIVPQADIAAAVAPGWHLGLEKLAASLDEREPDLPEWEQLQKEYAG